MCQKRRIGGPPLFSIFLSCLNRVFSQISITGLYQTLQNKVSVENATVGREKRHVNNAYRLDKRLSGLSSGKMLQIRASEVQGNISTTSKNVMKISAYDCGNQTQWQLSDFVNRISNLKCHCWTQMLSRMTSHFLCWSFQWFNISKQGNTTLLIV